MPLFPDPITEIRTQEGRLILTEKAVRQIEKSPGRPIRREIRLDDLKSWQLDQRRQPAWLAVALIGLVVSVFSVTAGPWVLMAAGIPLAAAGGAQYHRTARNVIRLAGPATRIRASGQGARRWAVQRFYRRLTRQVGSPK